MCKNPPSRLQARILYSSDLEGTAFPEAGKYGEHAWSLRKLANHERSLLRFVEYTIPGVNTPMLYLCAAARAPVPARHPTCRPLTGRRRVTLAVG